MGKAARIACIFVPMALTIICLVFLSMIGLGQTNAGSNYLSNLYFLRADTQYNRDSPSPDLVGHKADNETDSHDKNAQGDIIIYKYYTIGLWNYCAGNGSKVDHDVGEIGQSGAYKVDFCSARKTNFVFNPEKVWNLSSTFTTKFFSGTLSKWLDEYENALGKALGPVYIVTVGAAAVEVLVGLAAIFSRLGSVATTITASIAGLFSFAFAILISVAYFSLAGAFNTALDKEGVHMDIGHTMYIYAWLTVVFQTVATLCWGFTACCVSGRSRRGDKEGKNIRMVDSPFHGGNAGYQKMEGSEGLMGHGAPMGHGGHGGHAAYGVTEGTAYEPYRHS